MNNGYFFLTGVSNGYGLKLIMPRDGGEEIRIGEAVDYLNGREEAFELQELKKLLAENQDAVLFLGEGECPVDDERYTLTVSADNMQAAIRFFAPSETGKRLTLDDLIKELRGRNITSGIQMQTIQEHLQSNNFCTDLIVAKGREPRHGTDARIEYYFNTDVHVRPTVREDGSVDFFHLNTINHCRKGDVLARIIPEEGGDYGLNILGTRIKPRDVKRAVMKFGRNIQLSEDRLSISSMVDGHVTLVDDKVFVSDVYEVENVDNSTGNIEFEGSVQINGNVQSNFSVKARGNVVINGVVEGAQIEAGVDIIIARGMSGMGKGTLKAGRNIVSKFLENVTVSAGGYVQTESSLHSKIMAGTTVEVSGKKGFIAGGHVSAGDKVSVKNLGSNLGASTIVEVGVSPQVKLRYQELQKEIKDIVKIINSSEPILKTFTEKRARGANINKDQVNYVMSVQKLLELKAKELEQKNDELKSLQEKIETQNKSVVEVRDVVYPGTTIVIGEASMVVQSSYKYCRFEKIKGEVKMVPL